MWPSSVLYFPSQEDQYDDVRDAKGLCDLRCKINVSREELGIRESYGTADAMTF